jgi:predicted MFS family arabinose efflux permease
MAGQALGSTIALVVVARVLAAIGTAAFQSNAYVMAGAVASDAHRGRAFATVARGMSVSMVLGVPIGPRAGQWFGWRAAIWGIGAAGWLVALAIPSLPTVRVPSAGCVTGCRCHVDGSQQHRLFAIAPDAPTVALGLNGSAMYAGSALGSVVGGAVLANAGVGWPGPAAGAVAGLALALR